MLNIPAGRDPCLVEVEVSLVRSHSRDCREALEGWAMVSWADREGYGCPRTCREGSLPKLICEGSVGEGNIGLGFHC